MDIAAVATTEQTPPKKPKLDSLERAYGTGKRKNAVARVWIKKGNGKFVVNKKEIKAYFGRPVLQMIVNQAFKVTDSAGQYDVFCTVKGGGLSGQAGAVLHGISKALDNFNPEAYHVLLRKAGLLTRNSKVVERKKYGRKKARKRFQFSKR